MLKTNRYSSQANVCCVLSMCLYSSHEALNINIFTAKDSLNGPLFSCMKVNVQLAWSGMGMHAKLQVVLMMLCYSVYTRLLVTEVRRD